MYLTQVTVFDGSLQEYEVVKIPGRTGDLLLSNDRYENVTVTYEFFVRGDFEEKARAIRNWLLSAEQNLRLQDTYQPNFFRFATYIDSLSFKRTHKKFGSSSISFTADPRLFSIEGYKEHTFTATQTNRSIYIPTPFPSKPLYKIIGSGEGWFSVNGEEIHIFGIENNLICDVEHHLQYCDYYAGQILNKSSTIDKSPPPLKAGSNWFSFRGAVEQLIVIPRWFTL